MPNSTYFNLPIEKQNKIFQSAVNEFASTNYDHAKLSHIIKNAGIPRGSFYQYFEDKLDLYLFIFQKIGEEKLTYMSDTLKNPFQMPFLSLFKELYIMGVKFALDNPKYIKITSHLFATKGALFDKVMHNNFDLAIDMYSAMINKDKELGRIREDIDTTILAKLVLDMTVNISSESIETPDGTFKHEQMDQQINQIISIFEKGIQKGE